MKPRPRVGWRLAWILSGAVLGFAPVTRADYLEVRHSATLKAAPADDGAIVLKLAPGDLVVVDSDDEQQGYYQVHTQDGVAGFVYRTLLRRHTGALPSPAAPKGSTSTTRAAIVSGEHFDPDKLGPLGVPGQTPAMRAHFIDVGQGAATLVEFSCGAALVDTGGESNALFDSGKALQAYLNAFFERRSDLKKTLDLVVLSHPHKDHTLNAPALIGDPTSDIKIDVTIKNVVTDGLTTGSGGSQQKKLQEWAQTNAALETIAAEGVPKGGKTSKVIDPIRCADEDPKLNVLWGSLSAQPAGWTKDDFSDGNNQSVVLRIDFGKASFLMTGDLELPAAKMLIDKHKGTKVLDVDVWEASHHGSDNGTSKELTDALTPSIALLATGAPSRETTWTAWAYGHPRKSAVDLLADAIVRTRAAVDVPVATAAEHFEPYHLAKAIYATGWHGTILVTARNDGTYNVQTER